MYNPVSLGNWRPVLIRQPAGVTDVALTFDDGPSPETTPQVLHLLAQANAKATFFLTGTRVAGHPELAAAIVAAGHAVYGHAWDHSRQELADGAKAVVAMRRVETLLQRFRPTPNPYLLRLPYNTGCNSSSIHRAMRDFHSNVWFAYYTLSTVDHALAVGCPDMATLATRCREAAARLCAHRDLPGAIVLMHEQPIGVTAPLNASVAAMLLPPVLDGIARRGLRADLIRTAGSPPPLARFLMLGVVGFPRPPDLAA